MFYAIILYYIMLNDVSWNMNESSIILFKYILRRNNLYEPVSTSLRLKFSYDGD